jgi:serine/threonine protein kinase
MKVIANKYRLIKLIGSGGMGEVFLGEVLGSYGFKRKIAVKLLPHDVRKDRIFREAFIHEATTLAGISHPNLVKVFDFGDAGDRLFLCMEYIKGFSLRELLGKTEKWGEKIPLEIVVKIVSEILEGLHYIHGRGVVHGDLTPKNIMMGLNGEFKILDFGLSRSFCQTSSSIPLGGKAGYIAPEVKKEKKILPASDIYSLGAVIKMIRGGQEMHGAAQSEISLVTHKALMDLGDLCLSQAHDQRPRTAVLLERVKEMRRNLDSGFEIKDYLNQLYSEDSYTFVFPKRAGMKERGKKYIPFSLLMVILTLTFATLYLLFHSEMKKISELPVEQAASQMHEIEIKRDDDRGLKPERGTSGADTFSSEKESISGRGSLPEVKEDEAAVSEKKQLARDNDRFEVRSYPVNASVFLNGENIGKTPLDVALKLFDREVINTLRFSLKGYKEKSVDVSHDSTDRSREILVILERAKGILSVNVNPWAYVFVDGEKIGTTPIIKEVLSAGKHTLLLTNDKLGVSMSKSVEIKEGETMVVIEDFYR